MTLLRAKYALILIVYSFPFSTRRNKSKFRKRRKARHTNTDFNMIRPSIVDRVILARERLRTVTSKSEDPGFVYTEAQMPGAGKGFVTERDRRRGESAYTDFIQKYAIEWVLEAMEVEGATFGSVQREITTLQEDGSSTTPQSLLFDPKVSKETLVRDLALFDGEASAESDDSHRLQVLCAEFPELKLAASSDVNGQGHFQALLTSLLEILKELHQANSRRVVECRRKDFKRGQTIHVDYDDVHEPLSECLIAKSVAEATTRTAERIEIIKATFSISLK
jgi:hypothetical protein